MTRVRRLAEDLAGHPADATPGDISAWLQTLDATPDTTKKYRHAARAFFKWAQSADIVELNPVTAPPISKYSTDTRWVDASEAFVRAQRGSAVSEETIRRRVDHVRRFARETSLAPWAVRSEDYMAWIAALQVAPNTKATIRDSLRAFYRWAFTRGRIDEDPTAEPNRRATTPHTPEQWEAQVRPWRSWMRGAGHPESTVQLRLVQLRRFARDHASADPWDISVDDLIDWLAGQRWASETRRSYRSALRSFYRWATDTGRIDEDPTDRLPAIRMSQPQPRPAAEEEFQRALRGANERERLALRLAGELGMRCAEVAQVHARDITHTEDGWLLLVHGKGSKQRWLPVPDHLANILRSGDGFVFPGHYDGHVSPTWLGKRISALLPAGVTMHALRHRFATKAYNIDRDVFAVQQLLGHASPATTQRYVLVNDIAKRRLVDAIAAIG